MAGLREWNGVNAAKLSALTEAATIAVDCTQGSVFTVTLTGNRILGLPTNGVVGQMYYFLFTQDATGSRLLTYATGWKFPGGATTLTTTAAAIDAILAWTDGTSWFGVVTKAYAA